MAISENDLLSALENETVKTKLLLLLRVLNRAVISI
jgi:hypothetical protein